MTDLFQDIETFGNIVVAGNRAEAWFQALLLIVAGVVIARVGARA